MTSPRAKPIEIVGSHNVNANTKAGVETVGPATTLSWKAVSDAAIYRVLVEPVDSGPDGAQLIGVVKGGGETHYAIARAALQTINAPSSMRWRVVAMAADGKVVAESEWALLRR